MLRSLGMSIAVIVGWVLLISNGLAWADETIDDFQETETAAAYDQALLRFNNNIKSYPTFVAFKAEVESKIAPGAPGTCYELTGGMLNPLEISKVKFAGLEGEGWQKTSGKGWRLEGENRRFTEYRVNQKAGLLSRIEGVKPRFFFGGTTRICEFDL